MSKMVSARIPNAIYEQTCIQLSELGSSPTELVNAAFEYLVQERKIPISGRSMNEHPALRLSEKDRVQLKKALDACTLAVDDSDEISFDKKIIADVKAAKYESLA